MNELSQGMKFYGIHRQSKERRDGHDPGALGISGWRGMKWSGLVWLYREGKISQDKAEEIRGLIAERGVKAAAKGFKAADHAAHQEAVGMDVGVRECVPVVETERLSDKARYNANVERIRELEALLTASQK